MSNMEALTVTKDMANVKVFEDKQTEKQTNGCTGKQMGQKLYAPRSINAGQ